jgi:subtilisin family serine protease
MRVDPHILRALIRCSALVSVVLTTAYAGAAPTDEERRAFQAGVARKVLDEPVAQALETAKWTRIVVAFEHDRGELPSRYPDAALERVARLGFVPVRRFVRLPVLVGYSNAAALAALLAESHVVRISLELAVAPQLAEAVPLVNLDDQHAAGRKGAGTKVAIIDTGVDLAHPDLAGAVVSERCFCDDGQPGAGGCCPNGSNSQSGAGAGQDDHGHGTRVAGVVTSAGVHAPLGGAPDAQLVAVKVLNAGGGGYLSDILAGLDWVLVFVPDVSVVNMSLGSGLYSGDCDTADAATIALASAVNQLYEAGVLTVAGTGNNQSGTGMIAPACIAKAVSVGAVWDANVGSQFLFGCTDATTTADQVTCWSNSSTTTDVFAPGALMTSSLLNGTTVTLAGTSYATPIVSACAATLIAAHPSATPDEITAALKSSGVSVVDATNGLSFPRLDCLAAEVFLGSPQIPSLSDVTWGSLALLIVVAAVVPRLSRAVRRAASPSGESDQRRDRGGAA